MIDLAVFDVNETLFPLDPVADRMGHVGLANQFERWFARVLRDGVASGAAGAFVTFHDLLSHHLDVLLESAQATSSGPFSDRAEAIEHVLAGFDEVAAHPDVAAGLQHLNDELVEVVALTNGSAEQTTAFLERAGLEHLVAEVHDVSVVRRWKPAPEPYQWVLDRFGREPGQAAMIAVHPWDVQGAQQVGMVGAWLDRAGERYPTGFVAPDVTAADLPGLVRELVERA